MDEKEGVHVCLLNKYSMCILQESLICTVVHISCCSLTNKKSAFSSFSFSSPFFPSLSNSCNVCLI